MTKSRLLIIDNQPAVRGALRKYFESRGYQVAEASSSTEAQAHVQEFHPEALAVDCHLPDEDSNELMDQIQSFLPDVPVIMLASYGNIEKATQSMGRCASPVMTDADLPLAEIEKRHIQIILLRNRGNIEKSAEVLGISRSSLYERVKRYGIQYR